MRHLREYTQEVGEITQKSSEKNAKLGVKLLRTSGTFKDISGDYRKGWRAKKVGSRWIIHNATDYQLTHLLERGHVSSNGTKRKFKPDVKSYVHIKPVEERLVREFVAEVEEAIKKG